MQTKHNKPVFDAIILANGSFPSHNIPLEILRSASKIICCDGAVTNLLAYGLIPDAIVGDGDSVRAMDKVRFADRLYLSDDQECNDLSKAIYYAQSCHYQHIAILGATGLREDHCLGNIGLLAEYNLTLDVSMYTDHGVFKIFYQAQEMACHPQQQISIFSFNPQIPISCSGLRYPLNKKCLTNWWPGTLNETVGDRFSLDFTEGPVLVFANY